MAVVCPAMRARVIHPVDYHSETASSCFLLLSVLPLWHGLTQHVNTYATVLDECRRLMHGPQSLGPAFNHYQSFNKLQGFLKPYISHHTNNLVFYHYNPTTIPSILWVVSSSLVPNKMTTENTCSFASMVWVRGLEVLMFVWLHSDFFF